MWNKGLRLTFTWSREPQSTDKLKLAWDTKTHRKRFFFSAKIKASIKDGLVKRWSKNGKDICYQQGDFVYFLVLYYPWQNKITNTNRACPMFSEIVYILWIKTKINPAQLFDFHDKVTKPSVTELVLDFLIPAFWFVSISVDPPKSNSILKPS